ncbi:MAG: hypothetical protein IPH63_14915 [Flavobacteriales bacterium]|nr:hypothetical protein [Flavobacteriales bacterium]
MDRTILYALISMVFAGITAVIAKLGMKNVSGDVALAVRTTFIFASDLCRVSASGSCAMEIDRQGFHRTAEPFRCLT